MINAVCHIKINRLFLRTGEEILRTVTRSFAYTRKVFCVNAKANEPWSFPPASLVLDPTKSYPFPSEAMLFTRKKMLFLRFPKERIRKPSLDPQHVLCYIQIA